MRLPRWLARATRRPRPDAWSDHWFNLTTTETKTGLEINENEALKYSAVWACVKVISEDLASLPLIVYRRDGDRKTRAEKHPAYRLLHDAPNPEMGAMQFRECLQSHLLLWGNAYAEIQQNLRGEPLALWPLRPDQMTVERNEANELVYVYRLTDTGEEVRFARDSILHVAGLGFNGLVGYSPITYNMESVALGLAAEEFGARFFRNDASPRIALRHPGVLKEAASERLKARWNAAYGGLSKAHRVAILEEAMDVVKIGVDAETAQLLGMREFQVNDIARIFRIPPHKIMDLRRATFTNIEHQSIDYVVDTIRPWAIRWEQAINQRVLRGAENLYVEHLMDALLRGDLKSRYDAYAVGRNWGWLSANDVRRRENMDPIEEGGDEYLKPLNMTQLGAEPELPEKKPEGALTEGKQLKLVGGKE